MPPHVQEQFIAAQTILCCILSETPQTYHIATMIVVITFFTQQGHHDSIPSLILHHVIVCVAVIVQYTNAKYAPLVWTSLCWSARWLGTLLLFGPHEHPFRGCMKCLLFFSVVYSRRSWGLPYTIIDGFKWCWILVVHEIVWLCIPVQMLYEVYTHREGEPNRHS